MEDRRVYSIDGNHRVDSAIKHEPVASAIKFAVCLVLLVLLGRCVSAADRGAYDQLTIDSLTADSLLQRVPDSAVGLLVVHAFTRDLPTEWPSVLVRTSTDRKHRMRQFSGWKATWALPGISSFRVIERNFRSVAIDSLRIPSDSAVILTLQIRRGAETDTLHVNPAGDSLLEVRMVPLGSFLSPNEVFGTIRDANSSLGVSSANVHCRETGETVRSDKFGRYALALDTFRMATVDIWHASYDSVSFGFKKRHLHTRKKVDVDFASRRTKPGSLMFPEDPRKELLVVQLEGKSRSQEP